MSPHSSTLERCIILLSGACLISFALLLAGCGGTEKRSCTLTGFSPAPGSPLKVGTARAALWSAELNGDGRPDLVAGGSPSDLATVLINDGTGNFNSTRLSLSEGLNSSLRLETLGDFNGDGHPDLAVADGNSGKIYILFNDGKGGLALKKPTLIKLEKEQRALVFGDRAFRIELPVSPVPYDLNGDGNLDLASADGVILLGNGKGDFKAAPGSPVVAGDTPVAVAVAVSDMNDDGHQDLVFAAENGLTVLLGNGEGGFEAAPGSPFAATDTPSGIAVGDFNGDGHEDIALADSSSSDVTVLIANGKDGFTSAPRSTLRVGGGVGGEPLAIALGDFNGDEQLDIATFDYLINGVSVLLGNGKGGIRNAPGSPYIGKGQKPTGILSSSGFDAGTGVGVELEPRLQNLVVADFNGDGRDDLASGESQSENVTTMLGRCR